jgi:hypothetical protein
MEDQESKTFKEFLEKIPPGREVEVSDAFTQPKLPAPPLSRPGYGIPTVVKRDIWLLKPELNLYCDSEKCKREMSFNSNNDPDKDGLNDEINNYKFMLYTCNNCKNYLKVFAIRIQPLQKNSKVFKFGEFSCFGPATPPLLITLIRDDKDLFVKGLRAEDQSMGIGAFAYYRRVVENQKDRFIDEIIKATKIIAPDDPVIQDLEAAKKETQFKNAVKKIKNALPESLQINGENPLNLLHIPLSKGLHNFNDNECLEYAGCIRKILVEFANKLGQALKDKAEINAAVKKLIKLREK